MFTFGSKIALIFQQTKNALVRILKGCFVGEGAFKIFFIFIGKTFLFGISQLFFVKSEESVRQFDIANCVDLFSEGSNAVTLIGVDFITFDVGLLNVAVEVEAVVQFSRTFNRLLKTVLVDLLVAFV